MSSPNYTKIRLLHLVQSLEVGGAEMLLIHYIRALGEDNYKNYVYCFGKDGPIRQKLESLGVPVCLGKTRASIKQPIRFVATLLHLMRDLMGFIRREQIQVIIAHLGSANQLAVAIGKLTGVTVLPTIHNTNAFVDRRPPWDLRIYLIKLLDAIVYRVAYRVLVVSQEIKEIVCKIYKLEDSRVIVLKNGIVFDQGLFEPLNFDNEFADSSNKLKLIAVGSLTYQKAFEVLVKSIQELVQRDFTNLLVLIAGKGPEHERLDCMIRDLHLRPYVKLLGLRDDVLALMQQADLFVMPSRYEGLSIAMIEAMASELPVLASDAPGLQAYVKHGRNGLLFPVEDYSRLADHIHQLATDQRLRSRMSREARKTYEKEFNMKINIKILCKFLRENIVTQKALESSL